MEIVQLLKKNSRETPDTLIITGQCSEDNGKIIVTPKPGDRSIQFEFDAADILEGPIDFQSNTSPYDRDDVKAIRIKRYGKFKLIKDGEVTEVSLQNSTERAHNLIAMSSLNSNTYCVGLLEFECGSNKFIGPCIFGWDCY